MGMLLNNIDRWIVPLLCSVVFEAGTEDKTGHYIALAFCLTLKKKDLFITFAARLISMVVFDRVSLLLCGNNNYVRIFSVVLISLALSLPPPFYFLPEFGQ
jgi:hypothetical protein